MQIKYKFTFFAYTYIYPIWYSLSPPPILDASASQLVYTPIVPRLRSLIFVQSLLGKMTHEKLKCSHMLLVTKHEQTK